MNCQSFYDAVGETGLHPRDVKRFERTLPHILREGSLLDIGCGEGFWLHLLAERYQLQLQGIDVSAVRLASARRRLDDSISLVVEDAHNLACDNDSFDQVTILETLEHIPRWQEVVRESVRVARKQVVITIPYNQTLQYYQCECGGKAFVDGHINSIAEGSFGFLKERISFDYMPELLGLPYYASRLLRGQRKESAGERSALCEECLEAVPYDGRVKGAIQRVLRMVTREPEYMLVKIEK